MSLTYDTEADIVVDQNHFMWL